MADLIVAPDRLAGLSIDGGQVDVFVRKDAGTEIGDAVFDQDPGPDRPSRDHFATGHNPFVGGTEAKSPQHTSGHRIQAPRITILAADVDSAVGHGRSQPDRCVGERTPDRTTGPRVDAVDAMVDRAAEVDSTLDDRHVQRIVEPDPIVQVLAFDRTPFGSRPGRLQRHWRAVGPLARQCRRQSLAGGSRSRGIMAIRRPVGGECG